MEAFENFVGTINAFVWGADSVPYPPVLILLLLTGLYLTVRLGFMPIMRIPYAFGQLFKKSDSKEEGDVSPFGALMTALSSTIGTGNIAGVAVAIAVAGPGAVFWMWVTAFLGMATKFAEGVLAVKFREVDEDGRHVGGPMYYIKNGMGKSWVWLGVVFAIFGMLASWGTGAYIQSNSIALVLQDNYGLQPLLIGGFLALAAAAVILGGIQRIATVASGLVPAMAAGYLILGLIILALNAPAIPGAFKQIILGAFGFTEAGTGIAIGLLLLAMQKGVARGIFSNEAGQGSAPIAHAAAKNKDPVNQGIVAMLGTFLDTIVVCSITALVILTAGIIPEACQLSARDMANITELPQGAGCLSSSPLTAAAFQNTIPFGQHFVAVALFFFGFTTILGWSYYGERCAEYLFGTKIVLPFKISWIFFVFFGAAVLLMQSQLNVDGLVGSVNADGHLMIDGAVFLLNGAPVELDPGVVTIVDGNVFLDGEAVAYEGTAYTIINLLWLIADTLTGLMAAPNLVALIVLSPLVARLASEYFKREREKS